MKKQSNNILIPNPKKLEKTINAFRKNGAEKIHVLADFDNTLTKAYVNGKRVNSLLAILRSEKYLTPDYPEKSYALFYKYHPLENSRRLTRAAKKRAMNEWWTLHFKLLIKSGLRKIDIYRAVKSDNLRLRTGALKFFKILKTEKIPLAIISASGLGEESVKAYLRQTKNHFNNIHIISNTLLWNKNGRMIGFKKPIINSANKDETVMKNFPTVMKKVKSRTNVILLGDRLEDLHMITGFDYDHLIKIGFLNENVKANLPIFKKHFDVILLNDAPMNFINRLLTVIASD